MTMSTVAIVICDTFAVTNWGAGQQLEMLLKAIEHGFTRLTT